jgi:hypothetical protein
MGLYRGGRPRGTKNKKTDLFRKCDEVGLDVFTRMLELAVKYKDTEKEWPKLKELAQYLYAKPKDEGEQNLTPEQIREMIRDWTKDVQSQGS